MLKFNADWRDVDEDMDLTRHQRPFVTGWMPEYRKRHQKEWSEVIKHLGEEIPPQPGVRGQIRERESVANGRKCTGG